MALSPNEICVPSEIPGAMRVILKPPGPKITSFSYSQKNGYKRFSSSARTVDLAGDREKERAVVRLRSRFRNFIATTETREEQARGKVQTAAVKAAVQGLQNGLIRVPRDLDCLLKPKKADILFTDS